MSERRFLVKDLSSDLIILEDKEARHALKVLRLSQGQQVWLSDAQGTQAIAEIIATRPFTCQVIDRPVWSAPEPRITVCLGICKAAALDWVLPKLSELAVDMIYLFKATRSVVPVNQAKLPRYVELTRQAIKQCSIPRAPGISLQNNLSGCLKEKPKSALGLVAYEEEKNIYFKQVIPQKIQDIWCVIGPEGGLTAEEVQICKNHGFQTCLLTSAIMRAETAALVVAGTLRCLLGTG